MKLTELKWTKWGDYAMRTDNYAISKAMVKGKWIYCLWDISAPQHKLLSNHQSFKEAQDAIRD